MSQLPPAAMCSVSRCPEINRALDANHGSRTLHRGASEWLNHLLIAGTPRRNQTSAEAGGAGYVPTDLGLFSTFRICRPTMNSSSGLRRKVVTTSALGCAGTPWEGFLLAL